MVTSENIHAVVYYVYLCPTSRQDRTRLAFLENVFPTVAKNDREPKS